MPERLEDRLLLTVFTVSNTSNDASLSGSLPFEVAAANANTGDEAVIEFAQASGQTFATHQTITLKATLTLDHASAPSDPISIVGPTAGLTISGGGSGSDFPVITVTSDTQQAAIKGDSASGPITITNGNLTGSGESGAGIDDFGDLVLENVAVTNNISAGDGGGVEVSGGPNLFASNPGAALLASDTTFSGNQAVGGQGGGLDMEGSAALIVNCTFSGNSAGVFGGAINNGPMLPFVSLVTPANLGIVNDTVSGNSVGTNGDSGGIDNNNGGIMGILNSIVANNTVASGQGAIDLDSGGSAGILSGSSHDVIGSSTGMAGSGITDGSNGNVVGHPALLAALGDYGAANSAGTVSTGSNDLQTFALLPGSPAINDAVVMANVGANISSTATSFNATTPLPLPPLNGSTFPYEQGKDILVGSEKMLVTGVSYQGTINSVETYTLTVTRGVNGTTAVAHNSGDAIFLPDERGVYASSNAVGSFQTQGFKVSPNSGTTPQSTAISSAFANALAVTVTANDANGVVNGGVIRYSAPTSGASATLSSGTATIAKGAASVTAKANATVGSYKVAASAGFGTPATFSLTNVAAQATVSVTASAVTTTEGAKFSGKVATFTDSNVTESAVSDFTATIDWGDGTTSTGTVAADAGGGFGVSGSHQYATAGTDTVVVTVTDSNSVKGTANATATVLGAPAVAIGGPAVTYNTGGPAIVVAPKAALSTGDGLFANASLSVAVPSGGMYDRLGVAAGGGVTIAGSTLSYNGTAVGTFTPGAGTTPLVVKFNAQAGETAEVAVLEHVVFSNAILNPANLSNRAVTFAITDKLSNVSPLATQTVVLVTPPELAINGPAVTYNTGGQPVPIAPAATLSAGDGLFANASLSVIDTNSGTYDRLGVQSGGDVSVSGGTISYKGAAVGTFTAGAGSTPLKVNFKANATEAAIQAIVREIDFSNAIINPANLSTRTIDLQLTDGGGNHAPAAAQSVAMVTPPELAINGSSVTYNTGGHPVLIAPAATLSAGDGLFANASLSVIDTNSGTYDRLGVQSGGDVSVSSGTISYKGAAVGTFTAGAGSTPLKVNFKANATEAAIQAIVREIDFSNAILNPANLSTRTIDLQLTDGGGNHAPAVAQSVALVTPPELAINGSSVTYTTGGQPVPIAPAATLSAGDGLFAKSRLSVTDTNAGTYDLLGIQASGALTVSNGTLSYNGTAIGTFSGGASSSPLVIAFSGASEAAIQAVVRSITFTNTISKPANLSSRSITFQLIDGGGNQSSPVTQTVNFSTA